MIHHRDTEDTEDTEETNGDWIMDVNTMENQ